MKLTILLATGLSALALSGCAEERRGYGGGYGYERSTVVIGQDRGYRRDVYVDRRRDWDRDRRRGDWDGRRDRDRRDWDRARDRDDRRDGGRDRDRDDRRADRDDDRRGDDGERMFGGRRD